MRNGNDDEAFKYAVETIGSYRTYEEWKPSNLRKMFNNQFVLTVPMRNGNSEERIALFRGSMVLTVPMRNGNIDLVSGDNNLTIPFLPYL